MVKESMIHLQPKKNILMNRPQTFEMYSPAMSVLLEIFSCSGDLSVLAVDEYKELKGTSGSPSAGDVVLEQNNYGGHYVVSSESVSG